MTVIKQFNNSTGQWEEVLFGAIGPQGPKGDTGNTGPQGPLVPGGLKGQVLSKASNTNYDYSWADRQYKNAVDIREFQDNIAVGVFDPTYRDVTDITPAIIRAFGVLSNDGYSYISGQTPELTRGDTLVLPKGFYKCQPFSYHFPMHLTGSGMTLTRLAPVNNVHVNGSTAEQFITLKKGPNNTPYLSENHIPGSLIENLFIDGRGRTIDIGGLEYQFQHRYLLRNVRIAHFARTALTINQSPRESVIDYVYLIGSGDGSSYPQFDLSENTTSDDTNNMHFKNFFSIFPFGDSMWLRPDPTTGSRFARNVYFSQSMIHGVTGGIRQSMMFQDGYGYIGTPVTRGSTALTIAGNGSAFLNGARFVNSSYGKPSIRECDYPIDSGYSKQTGPIVSYSQNINFEIGTNLTLFTMPYGTNFTTGTRVKFPIDSDILPSAFSHSKYYFVILVDSNHIKLATTYKNAINSVAIPYTSASNLNATITSYVNTGASNYLHYAQGNVGQSQYLTGSVTTSSGSPTFTVVPESVNSPVDADESRLFQDSEHNLTTGALIRFSNSQTTSQSTLVVGEGPRSFTVANPSLIYPGQTLTLTTNADYSTSIMSVVVDTCNRDTGVVTGTSIFHYGSGTYSAWNVYVTEIPTGINTEVDYYAVVPTTRSFQTYPTPLNPASGYATTSSSSLTIVSSGDITLTIVPIGTFGPDQMVSVVYDVDNWMMIRVNSYNSATGQVVGSVFASKGSGTYGPGIGTWDINRTTANTGQWGEMAVSPTTFKIAGSFLDAEYSAKNPSDTSRLISVGSNGSCAFTTQRYFVSLEKGSMHLQDVDFDGTTDNSLIRAASDVKLDIGKGMDFAQNKVLPPDFNTVMNQLPVYLSSAIFSNDNTTNVTGIRAIYPQLLKNAQYTFEGTLYVTSDPAEDIKLSVGYNNLYDLKWYASGLASDGTTFITSDGIVGEGTGTTASVAMGTKSATVPNVITVKGTFNTLTGPPTFNLKFAQNATAVTGTVAALREGSNITFTQIG